MGFADWDKPSLLHDPILVPLMVLPELNQGVSKYLLGRKHPPFWALRFEAHFFQPRCRPDMPTESSLGTICQSLAHQIMRSSSRFECCQSFCRASLLKRRRSSSTDDRQS